MIRWTMGPFIGTIDFDCIYSARSTNCFDWLSAIECPLMIRLDTCYDQDDVTFSKILGTRRVKRVKSVYQF